MALARRSGQSFAEMLSWHPRDAYTLLDLYEQDARAAAEAAREKRFSDATAELHRRMAGGRLQ